MSAEKIGDKRRCARRVEGLDYDIDDQGVLVYWDNDLWNYRLLLPCEPITDPDLFIGKVGQQNLLTTHFCLKPKDLELTVITDVRGQPVGDPVLPGVSGYLFWGTKETRQDSLSNIVQSHLGRPPTKKNRLYCSQVRDIIGAGWQPFFAPLINDDYSGSNPLHVIIVPKSILASSNFIDATEQEKEALVNVFIRWTC